MGVVERVPVVSAVAAAAVEEEEEEEEVAESERVVSQLL